MAFFREAISAHSCHLTMPELIPLFLTWILTRELKRAIAVRMALSGNIYQEINNILRVSNFFIGY
jgi:putative transposase